MAAPSRGGAIVRGGCRMARCRSGGAGGGGRPQMRGSLLVYFSKREVRAGGCGGWRCSAIGG